MKIFFAVLLLTLTLSSFAEIAVKNGETIAFFGDSITQFGGGTRPYQGYILLVMDGLKQSGIQAKYIPAGVGGNRSNDLLARLDKAILKRKQKPDWMLLSCGVNDVAHAAWKKGISLEDFRKNITSIADQAEKAGIKVVIMTASMIKEDPGNASNQKLAAYNDFLRAFARKRHYLLADINAEMQKELASPALKCIQGNKLTYDGIHMNGRGNCMMASVILRTFGVPESKVREYRAGWEKKYPAIEVKIPVSFEDQMIFEKKAAAKGMKLDAYLRSLLQKDK